MDYQFKKHYTREEAQGLLPQIRLWLQRLALLRERLAGEDEWLNSLLARGEDAGGTRVNELVHGMVDARRILGEFQKREIQIKDLDRGLVDFPSLIDGREVFLCWKQDEETVEYWHDLDAGYAGRERI